MIRGQPVSTTTDGLKLLDDGAHPPPERTDVPETPPTTSQLSFSERIKRLRRLPPLAHVAALREAVLAGSTCAPGETDTSFAWALLELAALPALAPAGPAWSPLRALAERRAKASDAAMSAIAACWAIFDPDLKDAARGLAEGRWDRACRDALADVRAPVRRSAARVVLDVGDASLAALAADLVADQDPEVARLGELTLVGMVVRARGAAWTDAERAAWSKASEEPQWAGLGGPGSTRWSARDEALLSRAVAAGLASFEHHRRRGVLLAAVLLCDRNYVHERSAASAEVLAAVQSKDHPAHGALLSLLRARAIPTGRARALEWLAHPAARRAALARLARADGALDLEVVLASAHLGLRPARAVALAGVKPAGRMEPNAPGRFVPAPLSALPASAGIAPLTPGARRLAPLWAKSIGATGPQRHAALEGLLADDDPVVRMACVRHGPSSLRMDQVLDVDERVSRSAYLSWIADAEARRDLGNGKDDAARRAEHSRLLALFSRLPHPRVRALAALDRAGDNDPFSPALAAPSVAGVAAAYRSFATDRAAFIDDLSQRLADASQAGGGWSRAMHLAKRLGAAHEVEHHLRALVARGGANADLARNIAQGVTLLGDVPTPTSRAALERALSHADARVRANAVESLAKHARVCGASAPTSQSRSRWRGLNDLVELKGDTHHRVRANAVRAALAADIAGVSARHEDAILEVKPDALSAGVEALASMLSDDRTMHRLAGAWLAWKVLPAGGPLRLHGRWPEMVARVAEVAQFDAEPKVRARAARCAHLIESSLAAASMHAGGSLTLDA
jgi:hypothetical protein